MTKEELKNRLIQKKSIIDDVSNPFVTIFLDDLYNLLYEMSNNGTLNLDYDDYEN